MIEYFEYNLALPPFFPKRPIVVILFLFAIFKPAIIFLLFPEVEIAIKISPEFPSASICLENISLKLKSFPQAVKLPV